MMRSLLAYSIKASDERRREARIHGLAKVKELVEDLNGSIAIESGI